MFLPTDEQVSVKAAELGLHPVDDRAEVINALLRPGKTQTPRETLLSRAVVQVADGHLVITISHVPTDLPGV